MRIAVSADDSSGLNSVVSPHFGRCPYYVLVDLEGSEVRQLGTVQNPYYGHHQPGQVPGFIESQGADVMLAGGMGRRAISLFEQCGIEVATGASGTVRRALEEYLGGALQGAAPCRESIAHGDEEVAGESGYEEDEAGQLQEEIEMLQRELDEARERLDSLMAS